MEGAKTEAFGDYLQFETLTLFPYDVRLIDTSMLTAEEVEQVNAYHRMVAERLRPMLGPDEQQWLDAKCAPIKL